MYENFIFNLKFLIGKLTIISSKFPMGSYLLLINDFEKVLCNFDISTLQCGICRLPMVIWGSDDIFLHVLIGACLLSVLGFIFHNLPSRYTTFCSC